MMINFVRFNIYLCLGFLLLLNAGCGSTGGDKKKNLTTLEFHLEINADGSADNQTVSVFRDHPMELTIDREPFLDGTDVSEARVVDDLGGFKIRLQFNWRGTQLLASTTQANRGKRIAIVCFFGKTRWLGAPMIRNAVTDGVYTFTPDCSRDEADTIVKGLNDVAAETKKKDSL
jgi:preprotein translocase subunit SecD